MPAAPRNTAGMPRPKPILVPVERPFGLDDAVTADELLVAAAR
jgi:hypothetical protein